MAVEAGLHLSPLGDRALLVEPEEAFDPACVDDCLVQVQQALESAGADWLIYDLSRFVLLDGVYQAWLDRLARLCHLQGARLLVVGIRPAVAWALAQRLEREPPYLSLRDLDEALQFIRGG